MVLVQLLFMIKCNFSSSSLKKFFSFWDVQSHLKFSNIKHVKGVVNSLNRIKKLDDCEYCTAWPLSKINSLSMLVSNRFFQKVTVFVDSTNLKVFTTSEEAMIWSKSLLLHS